MGRQGLKYFANRRPTTHGTTINYYTFCRNWKFKSLFLCTFHNSYCTLCAAKRTILGPVGRKGTREEKGRGWSLKENKDHVNEVRLTRKQAEVDCKELAYCYQTTRMVALAPYKACCALCKTVNCNVYAKSRDRRNRSTQLDRLPSTSSTRLDFLHHRSTRSTDSINFGV